VFFNPQSKFLKRQNLSMIWAEEQWSESKKEKFSYVRLALRELVNNMHPRVEDIFCNAVGGVNSLYAAD